MEALHKWNAREAVKAVQTGKVSPQDLLQHTLRRHEAINPALHGVVSIDPSAQQQAKGLLAGLPISVKDQIHVAGMPATSGAEMLKDFQPEKDAALAARLRSAGATLFAKTNLPPLAMDFQASNKLFGATENPWKKGYTSGGSSGGAAVVAAGLSFGDLGSDLAGSLRIPASFCGVTSLSPTTNTQPFDGTMTLLERRGITIDHLIRIGPIARQVGDLALFWQVLQPESPVVKGPAKRPLKIAWSQHLGGLYPVDGILQAIQKSLHLFEQEGHSTKEMAPKDFDVELAWKAFGHIQGYEFGAVLNPIQRFVGNILSKSAAKRSPRFIRPIMEGQRRNKARYQRALESRRQLIQAVDTFLEEWDLWILPVTTVSAFPHIPPTRETPMGRDYTHEFTIGKGQKLGYFDALTCFTIPFSLTGHPILTLPVGLTEDGLPVGIQIIGKKEKEHELLAMGWQLEGILPKLTCPLLEKESF